jgi:hypothetical protein
MANVTETSAEVVAPASQSQNETEAARSGRKRHKKR